MPGVGGKFGKFGSLLGGLVSRFGSLGNVSKFAVGAIGKLTIPLTIISTVFTIAYQKLGWFKQGIHDLGRLWNETVGNLDFSWISKFTKGIGTAWDKTKEFSAKLLELTPMFKMLKVSFDGIHKGVAKATDKVDVFGEGVSKETKSALGSFVNYSEKSSKILEKMRINHGEITQKESQELTNLNKNE